MKRFRLDWTSSRSICVFTVVLTAMLARALDAQSEIALSSDRTSRYQIYTLQISPLGVPSQVTVGGTGGQLSSEPEWSPDGTLFAYQFGASGVRGIHTIHPDG